MTQLPFTAPNFAAALPPVSVKARQLSVNYLERLVYMSLANLDHLMGQMKHNLRELAELKAEPNSLQNLYHQQTESAKAFTAHTKQQTQLFNELLQELRTDMEVLTKETAATVTAKKAA